MIVDPAMLDLFRQELETQTEKLNEGLMRIERHPDDTECVDELMRAAHSLKGAARIVKLEDAVRLAHAIEDCFVGLARDDFELEPGQCDRLLGSIDLLQCFGEVDAETPEGWFEDRGREVDQAIGSIRELRSHGTAETRAGTSGSSPAVSDQSVPPAATDQRPTSTWEVFRSVAAGPAKALSSGVSAGATPEGLKSLAGALTRLASLARLSGSGPCTGRRSSRTASRSRLVQTASPPRSGPTPSTPPSTSCFRPSTWTGTGRWRSGRRGRTA